MGRRVPWKLLGVAGLTGVAATGVVVARRRREAPEVPVEELRDRLHERLAASGMASRDNEHRTLRRSLTLDGVGEDRDRGGAGRVAVTGATGALGGLAAQALGARGVPTRLVVRDAERAPRLEGADVAQVPGGYDDRDGLTAALSGCDRVLLIPAREHPQRVAQHATVIDAARDAGARHLVYVSFVGAAPDATFTLARDHWATEEHLRRSGLPHTILRVSIYADFLGAFVQDGELRGPAGDGAFAPVYRQDVADAAAAVLADPGRHAGRTYDLTGPQRLTMAEVAQKLGATYVPETLDEARAARAHLAEPWEVEGWVTSYAAIAAGELDVLTADVERLTGRQAMAFTV